MASINIALEAFGVIVSFLLLFSLLSAKDRSPQKKIFTIMLALNIAVLFCDIYTWAAKSPETRMDCFIANFFVYSLGYVIVQQFSCYLVSFIAPNRTYSRVCLRVITVMCAVAVALVVVSMFNGMYFTYDMMGNYIRGPLYWVSQAYPVVIMMLQMAYILSYAKKLGWRDTLTLLSYGALPIIAMLFQIFFYGITLLYLATTLSLMLIYINIQMEQNRRLIAKEAELTQNRMAIMLSQIQPHFLYNALGSIQRLCRVNPELAEKATIEFSIFLRGNMDSLTMDKPISFKQEMEHTEHYLAIEKLRFPERLNVVYDIQATMFRLPTLTLQPIVENAVRYGVTKREEGGTVWISTCDTKNAYQIIVKDDGLGFDPMLPHEDGRTHIGIQNVKERLMRMCGGTLTIKSTPGVGTLAEITIPKGEEA